MGPSSSESRIRVSPYYRGNFTARTVLLHRGVMNYIFVRLNYSVCVNASLTRSHYKKLSSIIHAKGAN